MSQTISVCVVTNSSAFVYKVIQSADQLKLSCTWPTRDYGKIPLNLQLINNFNSSEISKLHSRKRRPKTLASAFTSEDNESKSVILNGSDTSLDSVVLTKEVSSSTYSRQKFFASSKQPLSESELLDKLKAIRLHVLASEQWNSSQIKSCHRTYSASATNLIHYLALKSLDMTKVKKALSSTDLFNWEIDNSCILASLEAGIRILENSNLNSTNKKEKKRPEQQKVDFLKNKASSNMKSLLGTLEENKTSHIMVTVGAESIENETLVTDLIKNGASVIRINCAHGDSSEWSEIIRRVRASSQMTEKPCRVLMDLAGPKLRTGKLNPGPNITKISPKKNSSGNVTVPARIWLSNCGSESPLNYTSIDSNLSIDGQDFLNKLDTGDTVRFKDARGKRRTLNILSKYYIFNGIGFVAECFETSYIESGTKLYMNQKMFGLVVDVPASEPCLRLKIGDLLVISRERSNSYDDTDNRIIITCPSSLLFDSVKPGEPISFDDGRIQGTIESVSLSEITVSINHAKPRGTNLRSNKSINIPKTDIHFQGLTSKDLIDLEFVALQADIVGFSFIRAVSDIVVLRRELEKQRKVQSLGVVLKIETRSGVESLGELLMEAMKCPNPLGVMIARGDLAVECGWEKLGDIQQEIMSVCEACHVPVIWATQVLDTFLKSGVPSRAEITDVSYGKRASCVMLNKGRHVVEAVSFLGTMLSKR